MFPAFLLLLLSGSTAQGNNFTTPSDANTGENIIPDDESQLEHFKIGLLAPWKQSFDDFSALTSASAVSIAIEKLHADPDLGSRMRFR